MVASLACPGRAIQRGNPWAMAAQVSGNLPQGAGTSLAGRAAYALLGFHV